MPLPSLFQDSCFFCLCCLIYYIFRNRRKNHFPLPPGLPRWPILGNALSMPLTYAHVYYKHLGNKLGTKLIYLEALGQSILIINDYCIAQDLLEKRSATYSSRLLTPMIDNVLSLKDFLITMRYGDRWRTHRRLFQQYFSTKDLPRDQAKQLRFVRSSLLPNFLAAPEESDEHVANCVSGFILSTTYGVPVKTRRDQWALSAEQTFSDLGVASAPGKYMVNIIPQLRFLPDWFPCTRFKEDARIVMGQVNKLREESYQATLRAMDDGTIQDCFVSENVEKMRGEPDFDDRVANIKALGMMTFTAGAETTTGAIMTFILAMLTNQDAQHRAQCEIDAIIGHQRLPIFSDFDQLPYFSAMIKEVLRWNPIGPLAVPHMNTNEDVYEGYYIPNGCLVIPNIYAMLHDDSVFPNPEKFDPGRFLTNDNLLDPTDVAFGFGRRACPGAHLAKSMLQIAAASILCLFDIVAALDAEGKDIEVIPEFTPASLTSHPVPFKFKVIPRKEKDVEGLLAEYMDVEYI